MGLLETLHEQLERGQTLLLDGATGTELERRGARMHGRTWCAMATATHPEILRQVHQDYIRIGARVITTNTFSSLRSMLEPAGLGAHFESLNRDAVAIARAARSAEDADDRVLVAGSMSHQVPIHEGGSERQWREVPSLQVARGWFKEMAELLADAGVDLLQMEMMSDPDLAAVAIEAARATGLPVWVGLSVRFGASGELVSNSRPDLSVTEMLQQIPLDGVTVAGIMHSDVNATGPALRLLRDHFDGPTMVYPDSGFFTMPHWQFVDLIAPDDLVAAARGWIADGAQLLGGCCGLGVEHLRALATLTDADAV